MGLASGKCPPDLQWNLGEAGVRVGYLLPRLPLGQVRGRLAPLSLMSYQAPFPAAALPVPGLCPPSASHMHPTRLWSHPWLASPCPSWTYMLSLYYTLLHSPLWGHYQFPHPVWNTPPPKSDQVLSTRPHAKLLQSCLTLHDPLDCSPPGSSVHGILQARILEWVAMPSSRGSSWPRKILPSQTAAMQP